MEMGDKNSKRILTHTYLHRYTTQKLQKQSYKRPHRAIFILRDPLMHVSETHVLITRADRAKRLNHVILSDSQGVVICSRETQYTQALCRANVIF